MDRVFFEKNKTRLSRISDCMLQTNQAYSVIMQLRQFQYDHNDLINISPAFYQCVLSCCIEVLFIEIHKMYDSSTTSDGIFGFINTLDNNIHLLDNTRSILANEMDDLFSHRADQRFYKNIESLISESKKRISECDSIIKNIKTQRDKFYAHQDVDIKNLDEFFNKNAVSLNDLKTLLLLNVNLFNAFYMYFYNSTLYPRAINGDDFNKTVYYLEKGANAEIMQND